MRTLDNSSSLQGLFLERTIHEYEVTKNVGNVILHLRAAVGHVWFDHVYKYPHCWLRRHIKFYNPSRGNDFHGSSCHGSVMVFMGRDTATYERFLKVFGQRGYIPGYNGTWCSNVPKVLLVSKPKKRRKEASLRSENP